jgi:hypothetical protein
MKQFRLKAVPAHSLADASSFPAKSPFYDQILVDEPIPKPSHSGECAYAKPCRLVRQNEEMGGFGIGSDKPSIFHGFSA